MASGRSALITGITGQDGGYLAALLLEKGYVVHGLVRHPSAVRDGRLEALGRRHPGGLRLHQGDLTDSLGLARVVSAVAPDEVYNLGAQSHVGTSFELPELTANIVALGPLRLLEVIRTAGLAGKTRFVQASSSEMFGQAREVPQVEATPPHPRSPYGVSKLFGHWITINYREAWGLFASTAIMFNHESPHRADGFVTRKITRAVVRLAAGEAGELRLGNLDAERDWGHAREYADGLWRVLQAKVPDDFVLATGRSESVRRFVELAFREVGIEVDWRGAGADEVGVERGSPGRRLVSIDPSLRRPAEVDRLLGDATKARDVLGWRATTSLEMLVREMMAEDVAEIRREAER